MEKPDPNEPIIKFEYTDLEVGPDGKYIRKVEDIPLYLAVREILRHYLEFESQFHETGSFDINCGVLSINFLQLQGCLKSLSPRKKQAIFYNVILDKKQKEAGDIMGISTVSIGQYVEVGCRAIAKDLFPELYPGGDSYVEA